MGTLWSHKERLGLQSSVNLMITHTLHVNTAENEESDAVLRSFWELEFLGILVL